MAQCNSAITTRYRRYFRRGSELWWRSASPPPPDTWLREVLVASPGRGSSAWRVEWPWLPP
ncbi:hypothetical protein WDZ11_06275 [Roseomonas mucosa]|uniref:hypothetical protein n=1 Tax=Roseomonas TaxID=125216 RepID=UPI001867562B|nr:hypothetical protein [Roseomonas sp. FDAARGOS_362]USQ72612.1 hypothetical protein NF552_05245 [Roseomonas mucosa]